MIPRRGRIWLTGETEFETDDGEIRRVGPGDVLSVVRLFERDRRTVEWRDPLEPFAIVVRFLSCVRSRDLRSEAARADRISAPRHIEVYDIAIDRERRTKSSGIGRRASLAYCQGGRRRTSATCWREWYGPPSNVAKLRRKCRRE